MRNYTDSVILKYDDADDGNAGVNKSITVRFSDSGTLATLYTDEGVTPLINPFFSDVNGKFSFFVADGTYSIIIDEGGSEQNIIPDQQIYDTPYHVLNFKQLNDALNSNTVALGCALNIAEREQGFGGGAMWDAVLASSVTPNDYNVVQCIGVPTLALVLRVDESTNQTHFGVTGVGYPTDEGGALNAYVDYCRDNQRIVKLSNANGRVLIYTSETIDFQGVDVLGDRASSINFGATTSAPNFELLTGIPTPRPAANIAYEDEERLPQFGVCIYSDTVDKIVLISTINLYQGFGVSGWLEKAGQVCIENPFNATYVGVSFNLTDVRVSGSGGDGISLPNGVEVCKWFGVTATQCNGYGVSTAGAGGDDNQEYLFIERCTFSANRLDGFLMSEFKKNVVFQSSSGNSNGWYGYGVNSVGKPADQRFIRGMFRMEGVQTFGASNFKMIDCYAEDCAKLATFELDQSLFNLTLDGNYIIPTLGLSDTTNDLFYFYQADVAQVYYPTIKNNFTQQAARGLIFRGDVVAANWVSPIIQSGQTTGYDENELKRIFPTNCTFDEEVRFEKHPNTASGNIGDGVGGAYVSTFIKDSLSASGKGNNSYSDGTCYLITCNWQATNANTGGGYLLFAYKAAGSGYRGSYVAFNDVTGFTSPPTIDTSTGDLTVTLDAFYRAQINRIDINGYLP